MHVVMIVSGAAKLKATRLYNYARITAYMCGSKWVKNHTFGHGKCPLADKTINEP